MLVLSRRKGERIVVPGCGVEVEIVAVHGKTIRLGITAPRSVIVKRSEIYKPACPPKPSPSTVE